MGVRIHSNYCPASKHILPSGNTSTNTNTNTNTNTTPSGKESIQTQTSNSGTKQALLTPTQFKGQKESHHYICQRQHWQAILRDMHMLICIHSQFCICSNINDDPTPRSYHTTMLKIDVLHHWNRAETTFRSNSNTEAHEKTLDSEVHQLLKCFEFD